MGRAPNSSIDGILTSLSCPWLCPFVILVGCTAPLTAPFHRVSLPGLPVMCGRSSTQMVIQNLPRLKVGALREQEMVPGSKRAGAMQKNPGCKLWSGIHLWEKQKSSKRPCQSVINEDGVGKVSFQEAVF